MQINAIIDKIYKLPHSRSYFICMFYASRLFSNLSSPFAYIFKITFNCKHRELVGTAIFIIENQKMFFFYKSNFFFPQKKKKKKKMLKWNSWLISYDFQSKLLTQWHISVVSFDCECMKFVSISIFIKGNSITFSPKPRTFLGKGFKMTALDNFQTKGRQVSWEIAHQQKFEYYYTNKKAKIFIWLIFSWKNLSQISFSFIKIFAFLLV